jgi:hypothetical protein
VRASDVTINERLIALRKDGPEKLLRKRRPKGTEVKHRKELNADDMYRTPMDDSGHLYRDGSIFFECGRYVEYPYFYDEGWDMFFGPYYVQVDTRKRDGNLCVLCKAQRAAAAEQEKWDLASERAARSHGVTTKYPAAKKRDDTPPEAIRWLGRDKARRLYAG